MSPLNRPKANEARATPHGRIQRSAAGETPQQISIGIEDVDKAVARTSYVVMLCRVLLGVGDEEIAIDVLNAEGRKTGRDVRVSEVTVDSLLVA